MMFSLSFVAGFKFAEGGSKSRGPRFEPPRETLGHRHLAGSKFAEGGPYPPADLDGGSISAGGFGPPR